MKIFTFSIKVIAGFGLLLLFNNSIAQDVKTHLINNSGDHSSVQRSEGNPGLDSLSNNRYNNLFIPNQNPGEVLTSGDRNRYPLRKISTEALPEVPEKTMGTKAVPANDDICNAVSLPLTGLCVTNQTNVGSGRDYYGGCIPVNASSVWFSFVLTGSNDQVDITFTVPGGLGAPSLGQGNDIYVFLMEGSCTAPSGIATQCSPAGSTFHFDHLTAGVTYYLEVATKSPNTGNFNICAVESVMPVGNQVGDEQDCAGAIALCTSTYSYVGSYFNHGSVQEVSGSTCLLAGETNSVWYVFTVQNSGTFGFTITTNYDYDFALYNLTAIGGCGNVPTATPVRCNFSAAYGNTGLTLPGTTEYPAISVPALGSAFMSGISNITAGNTYALIVDNWTGDNTGFSINFTGTATIYDNTPPQMSAIAPVCTGNTILLTMNEPVQCLSVQQNDFRLIQLPATDVTSKITQIIGYNCPSTSGALTSQVEITHDGSLATGQYQLVINPNPTLADKCGNKIIAGSTINFNYLSSITLSSSPAGICAGGSITLNADGADGLVTYNLNPGNLDNGSNGIYSGLSPGSTTTYIVSATYGGCTRTASCTVPVDANIITSISPGTTTVCSFSPPVVLTANTSINGTNCVGCSYQWNTGATTSSISASSAGTYTVTVTTANGCHNGNSPSTTLTLASAGSGAGSCEVLYVSPGGGGTGLSKTSPTTLANAIAQAQCSYVVIKMQKGIYSLGDYQAVHSYVTLEGGYDAGFTNKSSDLSGGTNSTTIRRSNTPDSDNAGWCTCFKVDNAAQNFRIQDIRIELPGAASGIPGHAAGSGRTNYGIKLGSACTGYTIVRCYIDAGSGSAP